MVHTITLCGSHGEVTLCAVSGHVIEADACDCEDHEKWPDYRGIKWFDLSGFDPDILKHGSGDILGAAFVDHAGYCRALTWVASDDGTDGWYDDVRLLPAPRS